MDLLEKYPEHKKLIKLGDHCIYSWECFKLAESYCNTKELFGWHELDGTIAVIFKEYAFLQVAKLHDNISIGKFKNHTIEFVIKGLPDHQDLLKEYKDLCSQNDSFISSIKLARSKIIAHHDVEAVSRNSLLGDFPKNSNTIYFNNLHSLMDKLYKHVGMGCFPKWPSFNEDDVQDFVDTLIKLKKC